MGVDQEFHDVAAGIFFPYYHERLQKARHEKIEFVHYTSADVACSIIDNASIWLRNSRLMNDFGEIHHGQHCLDFAFAKHGDELFAALDDIATNIPPKVKNALNNLLPSQIEDTFLLSLSEHGSTVLNEDRHGRLSMWRAYGGDTNVAIIFRSEALLDNNASISAFGSPVLYADHEDFSNHLLKVAENIREEKEYLQSQPENTVTDYIIRALHFAILSTKHPGFSEEREWRILHCPSVWRSDFLEEFYTSVNGIPQRAYRLPFKNTAEHGLPNFEVKDLIKRIIIGPNQFPNVVAQALVEKLRTANVQNPQNLITVSTIPLRR